MLLPVHDAVVTLADAVRSVRGQTGFESDLEIVIADDGSGDGSLEVARAEARRDARVRVLDLPHRGLVPTLNTALAEARGEYIARMDADDLSDENRLGCQLRHLQRHPRLDVVGTGVRLFPGHAVTPNMLSYIRWQNRLVIHRAIEENLLVECPLTHPTALFRGRSLSALGGWRDVDGPEDMDLWLRGARAGWRFGKVNRVLYHWRESDDRMSRRDSRYSRIAFQRLALDACAAALEKDTEVVLWGWGNSLDIWEQGLRSRGIRVAATAVNPRSVRGGSLPALPSSPRTVLLHENKTEGGACWLLGYGTARSRNTLALHLGRRGYRSGVHYRFVS